MNPHVPSCIAPGKDRRLREQHGRGERRQQQQDRERTLRRGSPHSTLQRRSKDERDCNGRRERLRGSDHSNGVVVDHRCGSAFDQQQHVWDEESSTGGIRRFGDGGGGGRLVKNPSSRRQSGWWRRPAAAGRSLSTAAAAAAASFVPLVRRRRRTEQEPAPNEQRVLRFLGS
jgi:hypothetical protein